MEKKMTEIKPEKKTKLITIEYDEYLRLEEYGNMVRRLVAGSNIRETRDPKDDRTKVYISFPKGEFLNIVGLNVPANEKDITVEVK